MGTFSIWHWLIVLAVVLVLFGGGGKISRLMGDFGKGLKSFKKGMKEDEEASVEEASVEEDKAKALKSEEVKEAESGKKKDEAAQG
ncbi:MAG: twin-arginine translocase TatA/TatE family subunit [Rhodospirillales bacterium]